jgi:ABC-type phosphate/phosphonate transport system substrate-binding protein
MSHASFVMGAVAYDPKVVTIWDGFKQYFSRGGLRFDYVLYSNYEQQVRAHLLGHLDAAWNSPLAWLQAERAAAGVGRRAQALCMRDSDRDLTSLVVVRAESAVERVADLKGKTVAVGAHDSPQATMIPLSFLAQQGVVADRDFTVKAFDVLVGKHGDHIGGEREAVRALIRGDVDAACILDGNRLAFAREGILRTDATRILARTPVYDHCNFTVLDSAPREDVALFRDLLLNMSFSDPEVRPLLDLEGLKQWMPGRVTGYAPLAEAVDRFGTIDGFVRDLVLDATGSGHARVR